MKCILLCCVLAFCAFQIASSDLESSRFMNRLYDLQFDAMKQINGITNPIMSQIQGDVNSAKANGKNAQPCYERARLVMKSYVDPSFSALTKCRTDAFEARSTSLAISCNNGVVSTFRQNAQTVRPIATSCIANL